MTRSVSQSSGRPSRRAARSMPRTINAAVRLLPVVRTRLPDRRLSHRFEQDRGEPAKRRHPCAFSFGGSDPIVHFGHHVPGRTERELVGRNERVDVNSGNRIRGRTRGNVKPADRARRNPRHHFAQVRVGQRSPTRRSHGAVHGGDLAPTLLMTNRREHRYGRTAHTGSLATHLKLRSPRTPIRSSVRR